MGHHQQEKYWEVRLGRVGEFEIKEFFDLCNEQAFLKTYKPGQDYACQGDMPYQLSMVLTGKMDIKDGQKLVGSIGAHTWIDGAEYFDTSRPYNYTITASEEVVVLAWKHQMLDALERENPHLVGTLKNAIARSLVENMKGDI